MENKKVSLNLEDFSMKEFKEIALKINKKVKQYENNKKSKLINKPNNTNDMKQNND